ncbi:MAG: hypothetical protein ACFFG0_17615 [Candidatus Thorarchaeota archaeon]
MKKLLMIFIILLHLSGIVFAEDSDLSSEDGSQWSNLSKSSKLAWVAGFVSSASVIIENISVRTNKNIHESGKEELSKLYYDIYLKTREVNKEEFNLYDITLGQLVEGMDSLYSDFKNTKIKMVDAIYIVRMEIKGKKPELIEAQKRYLRMQPLDPLEEIKKIKKEDYKNVNLFKEKALRIGDFVTPKKNNPSVYKDYEHIILFQYGVYK